MTGFICHDDYLDKTSKLSDEEVGRLFRACMRYHATGEAIDLDGRESIAFDFIRQDIDKTEAAYQKKCEINRQNRLSKSTNDNERIRPSTTDNDRQGTCIIKEKKIKEKEIKENSFIDDDTAQNIQSEQNRVLDAAEDAGFQRTNSVRAQIIQLYAEYGVEKMLYGIDSCVTHGAANLAYLRAVLNGKPKQGKPVKVLPAQDFEQRDYSDVPNQDMQRLAKEMEEFNKQEGVI